MIKKLRYKLWLLFGGRTAESGFKFLSKSILGNRKLISDLQSEIRNLQFRIWDLECHTPEDELNKATQSMNAYVDKAKELNHDGIVVRSD